MFTVGTDSHFYFQFRALALIARVRLCLFALKFVSLVLVCVCLVSPVSLLVTPRLCSPALDAGDLSFVRHPLFVCSGARHLVS